MKLSTGGQNLGVQSLGRETASQSHGALGNLAGGVVQEINEYEERRNRHEMSVANAALATGEAEIRRGIDSKDEIAFDDLPDDIKPRYRGRTSVPAFEVSTEIYTGRVKKLLDSQKFSSRRVQEEWSLSKGSVLAQNEVERAMAQTEKQKDYYNKDAIRLSEEEAGKGNFAAGRALIEDSELSQLEKDGILRGIDKAQEVSVINEAFRVDGPESYNTLKELSSIYGSADYKGALSQTEALQQKTKIDTELARVERINREEQVGSAAEEVAQYAVANFDSIKEQEEYISAIKNDEVRKEARSRAKTFRDIEKANREDKERREDDEFMSNFDALLDAGDYGGAQAFIPNSSSRVRTNALAMLRNAINQKPAVTDPELFNKLQLDIAQGNTVALQNFAASVSELDMGRLEELQGDIEGQNKQQYSRAAIEDKLNANGYFEGKIAADKQAFGKMVYALDDALSRAAKDKGQSLNDAESKSVIDAMMVDIVTEKNSLFSDSTENFAEWVADEGVTSEGISEAISSLQKEGIPVTNQNIFEMLGGAE